MASNILSYGVCGEFVVGLIVFAVRKSVVEVKRWGRRKLHVGY
jgi:hypothetical protein